MHLVLVMVFLLTQFTRPSGNSVAFSCFVGDDRQCSSDPGYAGDWSEEWREIAQSCLTLCRLMDCSSPGSSIHGIFQAGILAWVAISFSRGSSRPRDRTWVSRIAGRHFTVHAKLNHCAFLVILNLLLGTLLCEWRTTHPATSSVQTLGCYPAPWRGLPCLLPPAGREKSCPIHARLAGPLQTQLWECGMQWGSEVREDRRQELLWPSKLRRVASPRGLCARGVESVSHTGQTMPAAGCCGPGVPARLKLG